MKYLEYYIAISMILLLVLLPKTVNGQVNVEGINSINEDDVIICVNNSDEIENNGFICHLYETDTVDWYQDAYDGTFFSLNDSFDIRVVD